MKNEFLNQLYTLQEDFAYQLDKHLTKNNIKKGEFAKLAGLTKERIKEILNSKALLDFEEMAKVLIAMNKNVRFVFSDLPKENFTGQTYTGLTSNVVVEADKPKKFNFDKLKNIRYDLDEDKW